MTCCHAQGTSTTTTTTGNKSLHIAPMLHVTTREFRKLMRILSRRVTLWTEMVVDETIVYTNDIESHLGYERSEDHPIVCQIGGNNPETIRIAVQKVIEFGYDEINLNMDCPSNRVAGKRNFGAVLMKQYDVAEAVVQEMSLSSKGKVPISVKCRIGVDDEESVEYLCMLIERLSKHCSIFYLHARKCVLGGLLSPAQNRLIPPLNYPRVYEVCRRFPSCTFYINGGIPNLQAAKALCFGIDHTDPDNPVSTKESSHQVPCKICDCAYGSCVVALEAEKVPQNLRGCALGRAVRDNPCCIFDADRSFYGEEKNPCRNRQDILNAYCSYLETVYPRRCCDNDSRKSRTFPGIPHSKLNVCYDACKLCTELYPSATNIAPEGFSGEPKLSTHIMYRAILPILGIFHGLRNSRDFRREMDTLAKADLHRRNCGPASSIRLALKNVPEEVLQQNLGEDN